MRVPGHGSLVVAGSRSIVDCSFVHDKIEEIKGINQVISGGAEGVDTCAKEWAEEHNIAYREFGPNWKKHGKQAGPMRNLKMLENGDMLLAIWDGQSKGTKDIISKASTMDIRYKIEMYGSAQATLDAVDAGDKMGLTQVDWSDYR